VWCDIDKVSSHIQDEELVRLLAFNKLHEPRNTGQFSFLINTSRLVLARSKHRIILFNYSGYNSEKM
jgi:hypothetical protein